MIIDFPASPAIGDRYTTGGVTWQWDGAKWIPASSGQNWLPLSGGQMTGPLILAGDPASGQPFGAASKNYTDIGDAATLSQMPVASSTLPLMSGTAAIGTGTTWARADHVHPSDTSKLSLSGGTLTGDLILNRDPQVALGAASKQYVDAAAGTYLPLAGGTITGGLIVNGGTTLKGAITAFGGSIVIPPGPAGGANPVIWLQDATQNRSAFYFNVSAGTTTIVDQFSGANIQLLVGGGIQLNASHSQLTQVSAGLQVGVNLTVGGAADITGGTTCRSQLTVTNGVMQIQKGSSTNPIIYMTDGSTNRAGFYFDTATGRTSMFDIYSGGVLYIDPSATLTCQNNGVANKPGGGPWGATSDARIKTVIEDYELGLDEVLQLRPVVYTYKGNDTPTADFNKPRLSDDEPQPKAVESVPYPASAHYQAAQAKTEFVGLVAQEVEPIFPGMVNQREGYIDGEKVTDLRDLDTSSLIFSLVNAVKTLKAEIDALKAAKLAGAS